MDGKPTAEKRLVTLEEEIEQILIETGKKALRSERLECNICGKPTERLSPILGVGVCEECKKQPEETLYFYILRMKDIILQRGRLCRRCFEWGCPGWNPREGCPFYLLAQELEASFGG
jgi:hypothetical protein